MHLQRRDRRVERRCWTWTREFICCYSEIVISLERKQQEGYLVQGRLHQNYYYNNYRTTSRSPPPPAMSRTQSPPPPISPPSSNTEVVPSSPPTATCRPWDFSQDSLFSDFSPLPDPSTEPKMEGLVGDHRTSYTVSSRWMSRMGRTISLFHSRADEEVAEVDFAAGWVEVERGDGCHVAKVAGSGVHACLGAGAVIAVDREDGALFGAGEEHGGVAGGEAETGRGYIVGFEGARVRGV
ncbi:hypothetical protein KC352_g22 [Hortaea werneckii]|nr:hypothetical protein KC352_g22 [Hortaea werneckii]